MILLKFKHQKKKEMIDTLNLAANSDFLVVLDFVAILDVLAIFKLAAILKLPAILNLTI